MKAHMIRKMSEVIKKQRNQSLNIQTEALLHWYLLKDVLKYAAKLLENTMQIQSSFVV